MPNCTISGQTLHYTQHGRGFPILLGHSYLWDAAMWEPQIRSLSQHYQVIVPELWGHGQSDPLPAGTQTVGHLADQMLALLDALELPQCAVVGLSVGGMWGAELAMRAPERVRSLVLMDTFMGAESQAARTRYFALLNAIDAAGQVAPELVEAIVPLFFRADIDLQSALPAAFAQRLAAMSPEQLRASIVPLGRLIFGRDDRLETLAALNPANTFLLAGEYDVPRPPEELWMMAEVIGCDYELVPDAGHIASLENPAFVNAQLLGWLKRTLQ
ncbi:TPA: alpha/beta fold hydrolase [Xanthomonas vasicola pv. zeae]|uniref:2-succinyl-6-hydroxy-2, 4-cyclohexadiene-1-carboxylate synthase n=2 Tax=Xanthomonas vasicola TaxID=56459 RepID=A0AAE8F7F7_XANVA|nr:alpha/beta fold hydrolase [Xanthomonas vasicola]AVQ07312.1 2-succinyl-6-hydroxy-2,4-cyclohexadiene-1-carboxylate synthase [Xanthomonas vasicola pv. vasculorum]KEZ98292.1 2-succinyl-6-hydroxy-2,4-cyclohexadiene-1-carboxylate synthase [Xanthomonas vasicola pv. vasculorum NCPPB 895]KFA28970.1 2-succinyl-6-hydroxy-2,4-cyclohexadiene-1-carboxylate synthase [Xanthomonas vasicola pv. vasculorum NCPPB 1326]MBV7306570.1 alpha/beta fold hydrolase [Xanthomonas vasicola pv. vasculorum]MDO6936017.1 alph